MLERIVETLSGVRPTFTGAEETLHALVADALSRAGIPFVHEARLSPRERVDFLAGSVAVEIKRGKPDARALAAQIARYASCGEVEAVCVVSEQRVSLPARVCGKPVRLVLLGRGWGVAL